MADITGHGFTRFTHSGNMVPADFDVLAPKQCAALFSGIHFRKTTACKPNMAHYNDFMNKRNEDGCGRGFSLRFAMLR